MIGLLKCASTLIGITQLLYHLLCNWISVHIDKILDLASCIKSKKTKLQYLPHQNGLDSLPKLYEVRQTCRQLHIPSSPLRGAIACVPAVTEQYSSSAFSMQSLSWTSCAKHNFTLISNSGEICQSQFTGCHDIAGFCILLCVKIHGHRYPLCVLPLLCTAAVRN
jgi:hypothetical protein